MKTMIDEIFDRQYQNGRNELNASIVGLLRNLGAAFNNTFKVLNRIEYQAPWTAKPKGVRCN